MTRFAECLPLILAHEAGYVDDPRDNGGATNLGITIKTLSDWLGRPATKDQVRRLTPEAVAPIYERNYWRAAKCDELPKGVDYFAFDIAVLSGPGRAIKTLQRAAGVTQDGAWGPKSKAALALLPAATVISRLAIYREELFRAHEDFDRFGRGWLRRLAEVKAKALQWAS